MPLPLIVPIAMGLAGLFGAGKSVQAAIRNSEANDIQKNATDIVEISEKDVEAAKDACNNTLLHYGEIKIGVLNEEVQEFIGLYGRLRNVRLDHSPELDRLKIGDFSEISIEELRHSCSFAANLLGGTAAGLSAGAVTAFGAYSGTMALAAAGTGTAITGLSGVAATNATLAWLGGGTLAAGGYGMAGGAVVLGTLVAGPALLVLGGVLGARASKKLDESKANLEKAKTFQSEANLVIEKLKAIVEVTCVGHDLMKKLKHLFCEINKNLLYTIERKGVDFAIFDDKAKNIVFQAVKIAQLVKAVIDTPILNEDGSLAEHTLIGFREIESTIK